MEVAKASGTQPERCWCFDAVFADEVMDQVPDEAKGKACICAKCASATAWTNRHKKLCQIEQQSPHRNGIASLLCLTLLDQKRWLRSIGCTDVKPLRNLKPIKVEDPKEQKPSTEYFEKILKGGIVLQMPWIFHPHKVFSKNHACLGHCQTVK